MNMENAIVPVVVEPEKIKDLSIKGWWEVYGKPGPWYQVVDTEKYVQAMHGLRGIEHASRWALGRFIKELRNHIDYENDFWDKKYRKDPEKKPQYNSYEDWFRFHHKEVGLSFRQAKRYEWIYENTEYEFVDLGYKKNKMIHDFLGEDKELKRKFSLLVKQKELNEDEVQKSLEMFVNSREQEAFELNMKKSAFQEDLNNKVLKRIENIVEHKLKEEIEIREIKSEGKDVIIRCARVTDAERVRDVLVAMEPTIKLKAFRYK